MKEIYYTLLEEVIQIQDKNIEKKQWMLKTIHEFSQEDPLFDEQILNPLCIFFDIKLEKAEELLHKIKYDRKIIKIILACLKEIDKQKKYLHTQIISDLLIVWECTRLGKRMSGKTIEALHVLLDTSNFFMHKLEHEAFIQLKQREFDERNK